MNWEQELFGRKNEMPLDRLIEGYSNTSPPQRNEKNLKRI